MHKKRIISILNSFDKADGKRFERFLESPYFNKRPGLKNKFQKAQRAKSIYKSGFLTGKEISYLTALSLNYLKQHSIEKDELESELKFLRELFLRKQSRIFEASSKKILLKFNSKKRVEPQMLLKLYDYYTLLYNQHLTSSSKLNQAKVRRTLNYMLKAGISLTVYQMITVVIDYTSIIFYKNIPDDEFVNDYYDLMIRPLNIDYFNKKIKSDYEYAFLLELYSSMIKSHMNIKDEREYEKYKNLLLKYSVRLEKSEVTVHLQSLLDYCTRKIVRMQNENYFLNERFEIAMLLAENGFFLKDIYPYMPTEFFATTVILGLQANKIEETRNFIDLYSSKLSKDDALPMREYGLAHYYFKTGKYTSSLEHLLNFKTKNENFRHDSKILEIICFYKIKDFDKSENALKSYLEFLSGEKFLVKSKKSRIKIFLSNFKKLLKYASMAETRKYKNEISYILHNLQKSEDFNYRDWLISEFRELLY